LKALLVRLSSIGDVVHTLPTLAALRRHGWEADWLVEPASHPLLAANPALTRSLLAPPAKAFRWRRALATVRSLRAGRYDAALDLQGLWKSAAWARVSGARRVVGWAAAARRERGSAVLLRERLAAPAVDGHVIDKNLALLRALGIEAVGTREFPLPSSPQVSSRVAAQLATLGLRGFALLNPGGGWASKLWPPERHGELARGLRALGTRVLVSWGPGEQELAERVVAAADGAALVSFPTSLGEYIELARRARLVVGADTGPLHLACAVGTPVVALFGPTDPGRNGPFASEDVVVRRIPPCAPCYSRSCVRHAGIMATIPANEVLDAAVRRLASSPERASHAV
jgi:heptosyltransferase-1